MGLRTVFRWSTGAVAVGHPLGDLLVPLILGPTTEQADDNHGHVVAANTTGLRVRSQAVVHHVLADLLQVLLSSNASAHELDNGLGRLAVPNTCKKKRPLDKCKYAVTRQGALLTVTGDHQELIVVRQVVYVHVGVCGDDLLLGSELCALLELEIADSSGQGEVAVDTTEVDETAGGGDSRLLAYTKQTGVSKQDVLSELSNSTHLRFGACGRRTEALHGP